MAPCKMMKENARRMHGSARKNCKILHQSLILRFILHPILHPKCPVNTKGFTGGCRKCRILKKTFFVGGERRWSGSCKTSDFFDRKYGCFASKVPMFPSKKSDVFIFRKSGWFTCSWYAVMASSPMRNRSTNQDSDNDYKSRQETSTAIPKDFFH